jgi:hypothetical protein
MGQWPRGIGRRALARRIQHPLACRARPDRRRCVGYVVQGAVLIPMVVARDGDVNERGILDYLTMAARADAPDETAHARDSLPPWALARTLRLERITLAALSEILGRDAVVDSLAISTTSPVQGTQSPALEATVRIGTGRVHLDGTIPASSLLAGTPGASLNGTLHTDPLSIGNVGPSSRRARKCITGHAKRDGANSDSLFRASGS